VLFLFGAVWMLELNKIHHGDCLELMKKIPDNTVDLTVTSPPYDNLRTYNGFSFDFESVVKELFRVTKLGGVVVWVVGDKTEKGSETGTSFKQALYLMGMGFNLHDTMIWRKTNPPPQTKVGKRYTNSFEYMFVFSKGKIGIYNPIMIDCKMNGKTLTSNVSQRKEDGDLREDRRKARYNTKVKKKKPLTNVWDISCSKGYGGHPATFPEQLAADHIASWSNPGDLVLDPFMGSGTTAKMAMLNNRKYLGCEMSKEYIDIANKRIEEQAQQMTLI
jgi:DNA modification methylase